MAAQPGYHYTGEGHSNRLTPKQVMRLARKYGLPAKGIMQIAKGESGLDANVQQRDPGDGMVGYGLLQMTPNAWGQGSAARRYMDKLGGIDAMKDPEKNMKMARFLYKAAGNSFKPWYGTRYLTDRSGEGTLGPVRAGARVDTGSPSRGAGGGQYTIPGVDNSPLRQQALLSYIPQRGRPGALLELKASLDAAQDVPGRTVHYGDSQPDRPNAPRAYGGGGPSGKVTISPGADRAGAHTRPHIIKFIEQVAGRLGKPLTIGTGTNHSQMTTSGNVSDHWTGRAADVPLAGAALTRAGRAALMAAGMSPKQARKANGGIYNLTWHGRRVQVIFNTTEGGNHWNHLHVGISAPR